MGDGVGVESRFRFVVVPGDSTTGLLGGGVGHFGESAFEEDIALYDGTWAKCALKIKIKTFWVVAHRFLYWRCRF